MSIARLRAVLQSKSQVHLESTPAVVERVNKQVAKRFKEFADKGQPPPPAKIATTVDSIGCRDWSVRPIDLLRKIGNMTTPSNVNMAQLSASWATRRYFWAIAEPSGSANPFLLSKDARDLDFHQKNLLSDEFGIGFAALVLEDEFDAGQFVDISIALDDPKIYQDIQQGRKTQPDYLVWGEGPNSPYYVVECKGSQSHRKTSFDQLRRGLEQVPSIVFGTGTRQVITLVVATCMEETGTTVFVIDPPPDNEDRGHERSESEKVSERIGEWSWRIPNADEFARRAWTGQESTLLKWAGQYREAAERDTELEPWRGGRPEIPQSAPREKRRTDFGIFVGTSHAAFPELGRDAVRIFTGVEEDLFANLINRTTQTREIALVDQLHFHKERQRAREQSPFSSIGLNGTCMIVEGL
jgi:hypothetical protein